jgi:hypothetical protein
MIIKVVNDFIKNTKYNIVTNSSPLYPWRICFVLYPFSLLLFIFHNLKFDSKQNPNNFHKFILFLIHKHYLFIFLHLIKNYQKLHHLSHTLT